MTPKNLKKIRWTARIIALLILALGLPFYFGYGNPLPFVNPDYSLAENVGLTAFPLILLGLALGWKYEKLGAYLIIIPMIVGFVVGIATQADFPTAFLIALVPAVLYLIVGHKKLKIN